MSRGEQMETAKKMEIPISKQEANLPKIHLSVNEIKDGYAMCDARLTAADGQEGGEKRWKLKN